MQHNFKVLLAFPLKSWENAVFWEKNNFWTRVITSSSNKIKNWASRVPGEGFEEKFWYWFANCRKNILCWIVHKLSLKSFPGKKDSKHEIFWILNKLQPKRNKSTFFVNFSLQHSFCIKEVHDQCEKCSLKLAEVAEINFENVQEVSRAQQASKLWKTKNFKRLISGVTCCILSYQWLTRKHTFECSYRAWK